MRIVEPERRFFVVVTTISNDPNDCGNAGIVV